MEHTEKELRGLLPKCNHVEMWFDMRKKKYERYFNDAVYFALL